MDKNVSHEHPNKEEPSGDLADVSNAPKIPDDDSSVSPKEKKLQLLLERIKASQISSVKRVVKEIVRVINDPSSTAKDLKEIIELDPPLTAKVLRFANSAYFGRVRRISEIQQAIIWIGFDALKEIALSQKVCELFEKDDTNYGYSRLELWKHSVGSALFGKFIYRREFGKRGDDMYAAGLLHDIGIIIEDQLLHNKFLRILKSRQENRRNFPDIEQEVFGYNHADIGQALTNSWDLPDELVEAVGMHHNPDLVMNQEFERMTMTLYISDYICHRNEIGYTDAPYHNEKGFRKYLKRLNIRGKALEYITKEVKTEIRKLEDDGWFQYDQ
ncbi:MAG: HDOD domain-containing protein [Candidatus Marinimicrobia bacterium]|nr:HDOD domain-containing protein [Candidatus Neomarinimicrobiota bacterium]MCF7880477.1 HDOD domain-containing protein [Candidatus Neomarinimicrobiota bacterium]